MSPVGLLGACLFVQLAISALHKALDPVRARTATERLLGPASGLAQMALPAATAIEAASAAAFLVPGWTALGAAGAATIWIAYAVAACAAWLSGERGFDCSCTLGSRGQPSDLRLVSGRAGLLSIAALLLLTAEAEPIWRNAISIVAALGFAAIGSAAAQLLLNRRFQGDLAA